MIHDAAPTGPAVLADSTVLAEEDWLAAESAHHDLVDAWTSAHRERRASGRGHPVEDFLFTYYSHRPAQLRRWHPGGRVVLLGDGARPRLGWRHYGPVVADGTNEPAVGVDVAAFLADRGEAVGFVRRLVAATATRPAELGCFGLHEWAMVYQLGADDRRHQDWPLRLGIAGTDEVLRKMPVRCTHHDAFRFFTVAARPLNLLQPSREDQPDLEQPGCLHATMDLYKWCYKLTPAVPSSLTTRAFELAKEVRLLDMRASPYDLSALGLEAIRIEEPSGRAEYARRQRAFSQRGQDLRAELLVALDRLPAPPS
jgi:hypothetical protein